MQKQHVMKKEEAQKECYADIVNHIVGLRSIIKRSNANEERQEEFDRWISVKEKLPKHEKNVLAVLNGQVCIMNYFSFQENGETKMVWGYVYDGIDGDVIYDDNYYPTHWMDIPCPPK